MLEVRLLTSQYASIMAEVYDQCFPDAWEASFFQDKLESSCLAYGAFQEERLIGFIFTQLVQGEGEILTFCVQEQCRGRGIGAQLLQKLLQQSKISQYFLEVNAQNKAAISLYERFGFLKRGVRKAYYGKVDQKAQQKAQDAIIYGYSKK